MIFHTPSTGKIAFSSLYDELDDEVNESDEESVSWAVSVFMIVVFLRSFSEHSFQNIQIQDEK